MKKILYVEGNRDGTVGGSYYVLLDLLRGLDKTKYEPHVMFYQDNILIPEFLKVTRHVYINNFVPSVSSRARSATDTLKWFYRLFNEVILPINRLQKVIDELNPDIVHLNDGYAAMHEWILACYLKKIKVVVHDHGTRYPCSFRTKFFARFLDAIVSVSDTYMNYVIKQGLKVKRVKRVYNGLDYHGFDRELALTNPTELKKELGLLSATKIVGIVGNIDRWKGQVVVLKAIKKIKTKYPDIKCLIVGKVVKGAENYKEELDEYIKQNGLKGNVIFTGFRKDVPGIVSVLDVLIHASIEPEPFGMVILEGMAASKPIVATNYGGPAEILKDGETGMLVPPEAPGEIAEAIELILSNKEKASDIGQRARKRLMDDFSVETMVREIEKVYEDIFS